MNLQPTYGNFQVTGTVKGFLKNKEGQTVSSGVTMNGAPWKSMRMLIQTTEYNTITVELFGMKTDKIRASKKVGTTYDNKDFSWDSRYSLTDGYSLSGMDAITYTEDEIKQTKNTNVVKVAYDAIDEITELYAEGDAVFIRGNLGFNVYNGNVNLRCAMQRLLRADESKFEIEGNEPCSKFEQTIIVRSTELSKEEGKMYVDAIVVLDKNGNFAEKEFYLDIAGENEREKLAKNIRRLKPYSIIKVTGDIINEAIVSSETIVEDDGWGEDKQMQRKTIEGYNNALRITMADPSSILEAAYKVSDFVSNDALDDIEDEEIEELIDTDNKVESTGDAIFDVEEDDIANIIPEDNDDEDDWL